MKYGKCKYDIRILHDLHDLQIKIRSIQIDFHPSFPIPSNTTPETRRTTKTPYCFRSYPHPLQDYLRTKKRKQKGIKRKVYNIHRGCFFASNVMFRALRQGENPPNSRSMIRKRHIPNARTRNIRIINFEISRTVML